MSDETYQQSRGIEYYRGHLIRKWLVSLVGKKFWRAEVHVMGLADTQPMFVAQSPIESASLPKVVGDAKYAIGQMIFYGAGITATTIPEHHLVKSKDPFDALVMKSASGKRAICDRHWDTVKAAARAGEANAIILQLRLTQEFVRKVQAQGILMASPQNAGGFTMNFLLDSYAPICCWLGDAMFHILLGESNPAVLVERAREAGLV